VTRWVLSGVAFGLRLPVMGMPPREPSQLLMDEVRFGTQPFSDWFAHATMIPATLFADFVNINPKDGDYGNERFMERLQFFSSIASERQGT
jgi:hypothetical protein